MKASKSSKLTADALKQFQEGVSLVFSVWAALQDAVSQGWGGHYSREKANSIESSVLSYFCQPRNNEPLYIDDLEVLLCEGMNSLSLMGNEGECMEVAEKLMNIYEECLEGDYSSIQKLREKRLVPHVVPRVQVISDDDDEDVNDDGDDMRNGIGQNMILDSPSTSSKKEVAPHDMEVDGWVTVTRKKSKGKKKQVG